MDGVHPSLFIIHYSLELSIGSIRNIHLLIGILAVGNDHGEVARDDLLGVITEDVGEFLDILSDLIKILRLCGTRRHLVRKVDALAPRAQVHLAAVHTGTGEVCPMRLTRKYDLSDNWALVQRQDHGL